MFEPTFVKKRPVSHIKVKQRSLAVPVQCDKAAVSRVANMVRVAVEPVLSSGVHGWRRGRSVTTAVRHISSMPGDRLSFDIRAYFGSIDQTRLRRKLDRLDATLWPTIARWLPDQGLPTGFAFSPTLANLYLADIDARFPIVRYADNIMVVSEAPEKVFGRLERQLGDVGLECHQVEVAPVRFCKARLLRPYAPSARESCSYPSRPPGIAPERPSDKCFSDIWAMESLFPMPMRFRSIYVSRTSRDEGRQGTHR